MIKFNLKDVKKIGGDPGINSDEVNSEEFVKGLNVELKHGKISSETNYTDTNNIMAGKIA